MKIAIMQPYLFPYLGYFQLINYVDKFILLDDVNYIKKGWVNRNTILVNNSPYTFTVPIKKASQNKFINELEFSFDNKWTDKFFKTLRHGYSAKPCYKSTFQLIDSCFRVNERNVSDFIYKTLIEINDYIGIKTPIVKTSSIYKNNKLKGKDRLIDICVIEGADIYVNPIGGIQLYNKSDFISEGIKLYFLNNAKGSSLFRNITNLNLSIIDTMMNKDIGSISELLHDFQLEEAG